MKASELMIGDWVYVPHNGNAIHYGRITALLPSGAVEVDLNGDTVLCSSGSVAPIPLTPEILENNGFKRSLSWHYYNARFETHELTIQLGYANRIEYVRIVERSGENCIPSEDSNVYLPHVKYVHQLQQALRLCCVDKEITI